MLLCRIFLALALGTLSFCGISAVPERIVVLPAEDTNAVVRNPDMGWVLYENYPLDTVPGSSSTLVNLPNEGFPEVDAVALMFTWQDVERKEGEYDFSKADYAYDYWKKRGKSIQLRLSTASLMFWESRNPPAGKGIPDYVREKILPGQKQVRKMDGIPYQVEDARSPFYQERLERFLKEIGKHFGRERPVTLIDLRGFGAWGEWHSGFPYTSVEDRRAGLKAILDVWSRALPEHFLSLSYSYDPDGPKALYGGPTKKYEPAYTTNYADFLNYSAFDHALTKTNITFRRDGCGGAVHSNERRLCEEAFSSLSRGPFVCEFLGGYGAVKKGGTNWVNWMIEDALSLHPNYINLLGWQSKDALNFTHERPDLVRRGLLRMGYRLMPVKVSYPAALVPGKAFDVEMDWVNRGVGRAIQPFQMTFQVVGESGKVLDQSETLAFDCTRWVEGQTNTFRPKISFPSVSAGKYTLSFAIHTAAGEVITLPLEERNQRGPYTLGTIVVR
jgi:Domain of unknown function (DUF4832)/Beta-galactosidase